MYASTEQFPNKNVFIKTVSITSSNVQLIFFIVLQGVMSFIIVHETVTYENIMRSRFNIKTKNFHNSLVIRLKCQSQNRGNKKITCAKFPDNKHFLPPDAYQGVKKCLFFRKFGVMCFPVSSVLRYVFLPSYRQIRNTIGVGLMNFRILFLETLKLSDFLNVVVKTIPLGNSCAGKRDFEKSMFCFEKEYVYQHF